MNTQDLTLFIRTADTGSITRAAEQLEMTTASASAALKRLEKQLGNQLFIRSTRQLRMTSEGERFLTYCRNALQQLSLGQASMDALQGKVAGELRITAPSDIGRNHILPWLDEIMAQHPDLSINLSLGDSLSDFYMDRVDLAIRYGQLDDSSMVAFKLATVAGVLSAAPNYLQQHGTPKHIDALSEHNCLLYHKKNRLNATWDFSDEQGVQYKVNVKGDRSSNDSDAVRLWAVAGKGIAYKSELDMYNEIQSGKLIQILPEFKMRTNDLNLICPSREQVTPAVLVVRDFLRDKLKAIGL